MSKKRGTIYLMQGVPGPIPLVRVWGGWEGLNFNLSWICKEEERRGRVRFQLQSADAASAARTVHCSIEAPFTASSNLRMVDAKVPNYQFTEESREWHHFSCSQQILNRLSAQSMYLLHIGLDWWQLAKKIRMGAVMTVPQLVHFWQVRPGPH